jgi:hypothetical protein
MTLQRILIATLFCAALAITGCTTGGETMGDSGTTDTGVVGDTGTRDTAPRDTAIPDTGGGGDTGTTDSGTSDSGASDTGMASDAAMDALPDALPDGGRPVGASCSSSAECLSGICIIGVCRAPSCSDGIFNGDESDLDCGGSCGGCDPGEDCGMDSDCASNICMGGECQAPTCTDGIQNQDETDADCGGAICPDRCAVTEMCSVGGDCTTGSCMGGECQPPTCTDGVLNGSETDIDCGGPVAAGCDRCADFRMCSRARDCTASTCTMGYCGSNPCVPFGSDTFGYTGCSYTPTTLPCPDISSSGTATSLSDDDFVAVPIGFDFDFYGTSYSMVNVESNGGLSFGTGDFSTGLSCPFPSTSTFSPQTFIAAFWDDLDPSASGSNVWYETRGSAGSRQLVVQWDTERFFGGTSNVVFTVVLEEGSDDIRVCYVDTDVGSATYDAGASAAAGIQGSTTDYNDFSCDMPDLTDGLLVRYIHP